MGTVYRAERADDAFEMTVAVKLIRLRRDKLDGLLQMERRLLARLDHRNIARLIDGGATDDGLAYLVMEWVEGDDLDQYTERQPQQLDQLLDLFVQIGEAVRHAHQRQVVHGDLKPSNIRINTAGQVRLLDFGVARLVSGDEPAGQGNLHALTPAFCAPEQLRGDPISTRSDIWSLGVLLHWLLGGGIPDSTSVDLDEHLLPGDLTHRNDLVAIIERARAQDPEDRYTDVSGLLEDIRRYRANEPVVARARGKRYVFKRFVQRHKLGVGARLAASLTLCAALLMVAWQAREATQERDLAEAERDRAQLEAEKARQVSDFTVELFRQANPRNHRGREPLASDLARAGVERLGMIDAVPETQADFLLVLSRIYNEVGDYDQAVSLAQRAIDKLQSVDSRFDTRLAEIYSQLGSSLIEAGEFTDAETMLRYALKLGGEADLVLRANILSSLGISLRRLGRYEDAVAVQERALKHWKTLDPGSENEATIRNNMAIPLHRLGRVERAGKMFEAAFELYDEALGRDHSHTVNALGNLGSFYLRTGRLDEAEPLLHEALELRETLYGPDYPRVANIRNALGRLSMQRDELEDAEVWFLRANALRTRALGEDHFSLASGYLNLGTIATRLGKLDQASERIARAEQLYRQTYESDHSVFAAVLHAWGDLAIARDQIDDAVDLHHQALTIRRQAMGEEHADLIVSMLKLAEAHHLNGQPDSALDWSESAKQLSIRLGDAPDSARRLEIAALRTTLKQ